jgi:ribulose-phosphate 3-epimerase
MAQLVPSILENTANDFDITYAKEIKLPGVKRIQVDFGDGIFVKNKILPVFEIDILSPAFFWEAHLMVEAPKDFIDYKIAGFNLIIIHYEAYKSNLDLANAIKAIKSLGLDVALCLNKETPVDVVKQYLSEIKQFQLMGITPGFQGSSFFEETYDRIADLRKIAPNAIIEVDGGVNLSNIKTIANAGADLIILGSAITKVPNMLEAYTKLKEKVDNPE